MVERNYNDFSIDVLEHVFDLLDRKHLITAALVSRQWHQIANQRKYMQDVEIVFGRNNVEQGLSVFENMSRAFRRFSFNYCVIGENVLRFLEKYQSQITRLTFVFCEFEDHQLNLDGFDNLEVLVLKRGDMNIALNKGLPKLTTLRFDHTNSTADQVVQLCENAPNLREVHFGGINDDFRFANCIRPDVVLHCLNKNAHALSSLVLEYTRDLPILLSIADMCNVNLQRFSLIHKGEYDSPLRDFIGRQLNLVSLSLRGVLLKDNNMKEICSLLPRLQELRLSPCNQLSEVSIKDVFQLKRLKVLGLVRLVQVNNFGSIVSEGCPEMDLVSLHLSESALLDRDVLSFCDRFPHLRKLYLYKSDELTDVSAIRIFQLKHLQILSLYKCTGITEKGFVEAVENAHCCLKQLGLYDCRIDDDILDVVCDRFSDLEVLFVCDVSSEIRFQSAKIRRKYLGSF